MSEKTIIEKLLFKPGKSLLLIHPPQGYLDTIGPLPADCILVNPPEKADVVQVFVSSLSDLSLQLPVLDSYIKPGGIIWICYPKRTSGIKTDINRDIIWHEAEPLGWKPVSMFSIDPTWSAFRVKRS